MRGGAPPGGAVLIAAPVTRALRRAFARVSRWGEALPPAAQARLARPAARRELARRSYVDAYWRVREATPLILAAVGALNARGESEAATFWIRHLDEELGHDLIQYRDLVDVFGGRRRADAALARQPISPPSAAIVGYFHWQVAHADPHLLMVYRFFLELFMVELPAHAAFFRRELGRRATRTVTVHRSLDRGHVKACGAYLDRHFRRDDLDALRWSADFIGARLVESQLWIASRLLAAPRR